MKKIKSKVGTGTKVPGGLPKMMMTRVTEDFLRALDTYVWQERLVRPGHTLSRSDVVREMISKALDQRGLYQMEGR